MRSYRDFADAVAAHAVVRRRQRLQPAFGPGDKIFPPTYSRKDADSPPRHCYERRLVEDRGELICCLLDSAPSQANRFEDSLLAAVRAGIVELPYVDVDFSGTGLEPTSITSLEAPHRIYDALLRDSALDGIPFLESPVGKRVCDAKAANATALLEMAPTTLIFGGWHSQGPTGGTGTKFQRCIVSEIIGVNVPVDVIEDSRPGATPELQTAARRTSSRRDPAGIAKKAQIWKSATGWETTQAEAGPGAKQVKPSEIIHGSITPDIEPLGITMEYGEQTLGISLSAIRRLQFGSESKNLAARTYLASLSLLTALEQDAQGYSLRSRCDLIPDGVAPWELIHSDGTVHKFEINRDVARSLYSNALRAVADAGFEMHLSPIRLTPQPKLVTIIQQSRDRGFMEDNNSESDGGE